MSSAAGLGNQPTEKERLELLKLQAETQKVEAERDKAVEELRQSKSLSGQLGKMFTPVVAGLTIFFGYLAATHNQRIAEADLKVAKADVEQKRAEAEKAKTQSDLDKATVTLNATNQEIHDAELAAKNTKDRLSGLQKEYRNLQKDQNQQIALGNLRKLIEVLSNVSPDEQTAGSSYVEEIKKEVIAKEQYKAARLAYLTITAQNNSLKPSVRGLLYYSLFRATDQGEWLDQIRRLASQNLLTSWPTFSSLMTLKYYDTKDRADVMRSVYSQWMRRTNTADPGNIVLTEEKRILLISLDNSALLRYRAPFVDHLYFVRSQILDRDRSMDAVYGNYHSVPLGALVVWYLKKAVAQNADLTKVLGNVSYFVDTQNELGAHDVYKITDSVSAQEWLDRHKTLVNLWMSPHLSKLANASDNTMDNILSGTWLPEDLP